MKREMTRNPEQGRRNRLISSLVLACCLGLPASTLAVSTLAVSTVVMSMAAAQASDAAIGEGLIDSGNPGSGNPGALGQSQPPSKTGLCQNLTKRLENLCRKNNLSDANQALCSRVEAGLPGLCGDLDGILATAAADGPVLDALDQDFTVLPAEEHLEDVTLQPLVVGPEDLEDPRLTDYLAATYAAGETVAIVDASQAQINLFHSIVGEPGKANCQPNPDSVSVTFYGLHSSIAQQPAARSSFCLPGSIDLDDRDHVGQFRDYFGAEFPLETAAPTGGSETLETLASDNHCFARFTGLGDGAEMQASAFIRSIRSFTNQTDYYDVNLALDYKGSKQKGPRDMKVRAVLCDPDFPSLCLGSGRIGNIVASSPKSANDPVSSYPKGFDFAATGGFQSGAGNRLHSGPNGQGFIRLAIRAALRIAQIVTSRVKPTKITPFHNLGTAQLEWEFKPEPKLDKLEIFSPDARWLWSIRRDEYPDDGVTQNGQLRAQIIMSYLPFSSSSRVTQIVDCNLPYPWPRWDVDAPVIEAVSPASVRVGESFLIQGSGFYEGIVDSIVIGGKIMPEALYRMEDEKTIRITVPFDQRPQSAAQIQVTTEFDGLPLDSNSDVTVEIKEPLLQ